MSTVVPASEVKPGDMLVVPAPGGFSDVTPVTHVTTYDMATHRGAPVATSFPPDHRWTVLHLLTARGGYARFPHEPVEIVR